MCVVGGGGGGDGGDCTMHYQHFGIDLISDEKVVCNARLTGINHTSYLRLFKIFVLALAPDLTENYQHLKFLSRRKFCYLHCLLEVLPACVERSHCIFSISICAPCGW